MSEAFSPYAATMGFEASQDDDGRLVLTMPWHIKKAGRPGFVHGGALAGLLETVAYMTLNEALDPNDKPRLKPVNVTVSFLRGATEQATYARATIERLGRRVANVEAVAWQEDESKPVAMAQLNIVLGRIG